MDSDITFGVYHHGQSLKVPKLRDVVDVTGAAALVLNHLEGRGGSGVVDAQGVGHLCIGRRDCEIARDREVGCREVSEVVKTGRRREVAVKHRVPPDGQVLRRRRGQHIEVSSDVAVSHLIKAESLLKCDPLDGIFKKFFDAWNPMVFVESREETKADVLEVLFLLIFQSEKVSLDFWAGHLYFFINFYGGEGPGFGARSAGTFSKNPWGF